MTDIITVVEKLQIVRVTNEMKDQQEKCINIIYHIK